jgi:sugar phosphate isomerase/epimerase
MLKPAFSTVACPGWTLERVAREGASFGFEAVELRTFGENSTLLSCDPALTSEDKTRSIFTHAGLEVLSLGTSIRFDEAIRPPVLGLVISDTERSVREARRAIDLAVALECPFVRVFGFQFRRERPRAAIARILQRIEMVVDHAHRTGVRLVIENGGSFSTGASLADLISQTKSALVGACYALAPGVAAGEPPDRAVGTLGERLWTARIKDSLNGRPCPLGEGSYPCRDMVRALTKSNFKGPLIFEWDRLWNPALEQSEAVLPLAAATLFNWAGGERADTAHNSEHRGRRGAAIGP